MLFKSSRPATSSRGRLACFLLAILGLVLPAKAQLIFNFLPESGTSGTAITGFTAAGNRWSTLLNDSVTVNIQIGFKTLDPGILGQAGSTQASTTFSTTKLAMALDATSALDVTAVTNLQGGSAMSLLINHTNPGSGATPYLDADADENNTTVRMTTANAKALGLIAGAAPILDAIIQFSDQFTWDFNPLDGITAGAFDFVGVATHEIGHALGFISGVDFLDQNPDQYADSSPQLSRVSTVDLFRYSAQSYSLGALDWTADTRAKYFSIDGGATSLAGFSTGDNLGDGNQASHWKDGLGIGIMDPTLAPGELATITATDLIAFDVIGWDLAPPVSTPDSASSLALVGGAMVACGLLRRRRR